MTGTKKVCYKETEIALMKQRQEQDHTLLLEIHAAVVGSEDRPGLKGRVSNSENDISTLQNTNKILIGAIVTIVVGMTIYIIQLII